MQGLLQVSVVLTTYNGEAYVSQQLESLIRQTHTDLEIIIVDDNSTDGTWAILESYSQTDNRIKLFRNEKNIGYIRNFEKGISLSNAPYIAPCDQDDIWENQKIETMLSAIKDADLCFCDSLLIDANGQSLKKKLSDIKNLAAYNNCLPFLIGNCISGHASLIKRETLLATMPFPKELVYDWWIAFYVSCAGKIIYVNMPLVQYRQHPNNTIAAVKVKGARRRKKDSAIHAQEIKNRMKLFYETSERLAIPEKTILKKIHDSYSNYSIRNNLLRSATFFSNRELLLATKKRTPFRKWLFCLKMFFTII
jgi:glycosyltransferase involved in cell wall biosynthesis